MRGFDGRAFGPVARGRIARHAADSRAMTKRIGQPVSPCASTVLWLSYGRLTMNVV